MKYEKFTPTDPRLSPYVVCFYHWVGEVKNPLDVQSPPVCYSALVVNSASPYKTYQHTQNPATVPEAFVCGLMTSNYHLVLEGKIDMVGAVLRPATLYNFFGLKMTNWVNNRSPLEFIMGEKAGKLVEQIKLSTTVEQRISVLEDALLSQVAKAKQRASIIDDIIDWIDERTGSITIDEVVHTFNVSRRYLETRFMEKTGISPKLYARIKKFGLLSNKIAHSQEVDWQDIVYENGYHDQSHLTKEFKKFNGAPPSKYHETHNELVRHVK